MFLSGVLQLFQLSFDTRISLQSILTIFMWAVTVVVFLTKVRSDIGAIKQWGARYEMHSDKQDEEIQHLSLICERITTVVENLTGRVSRVEDTCDRRHNRRE